MSNQIKILFLAANPDNATHKVRVDEEIRRIDEVLVQARFRDKIEIKQQLAIRVTDLQKYLLLHKPDIVHFSGQGEESSEIILENDNGNKEPVPVEALSRLFSLLRDNIRCVVLNTCFSEPQAQAIAEHIDCVVGMSGEINNDASIEFSSAFYRALGFGENLQKAFDLGCNQIKLKNLTGEEKPKLIPREGIDPREILLIRDYTRRPPPPPPPQPRNTLIDNDWEILLKRIRNGRCTPFLGEGVNASILSSSSEIAKEWAKKFKYPLEESADFAKVAQFIAHYNDADFLREEIKTHIDKQFKEWQQNVNHIEFLSRNDEPLGVLAKLPFPIYITTNYDDLLTQSLKIQTKEPWIELCRWNEFLKKNIRSAFDSRENQDTSNPMRPLVYHLLGHKKESSSLVLSVDDYIDFLVNISKNENLIPLPIMQALTNTSLIFFGFHLSDWSFRVLHGILNSLEVAPGVKNICVAVQLVPEEDKTRNEIMQRYLANYFDNIKVKIKVYWGTTKQFAEELQERYDIFKTST